MMKAEFNLAKLADSARTRWFNTSEISHVLKTVEESNLKAYVLDKLPERPPNGTFFLIDSVKANKKWKQDGYNYVKRNNGTGFREDVSILRIGGAKEIKCSYSYIDSSFCDQPNLPSCRRIYKLINQTTNDHYLLVHYFNEKTLNDGSTEKTPETNATETPFSVLSTSDDASKCDGKNFEEETVSPSPKTNDYFEKGTNSDEIIPENWNTEDFTSFFNQNENMDFGHNFFLDSGNKFGEGLSSLSTQNTMPINPIQEQCTFDPLNNLDKVANKLSEVESHFGTFEPNPSLTPFQPFQSFPVFSTKEDDMSFKIVDYSPEWDYTKGGAKVIICVSPLCVVSETLNERIKVKFGNKSVPGYFIQPGVIKCYAPPYKEGFVKVSLCLDDQVVSNNKEENLFEFRKQRGQRNPNKIPIATQAKEQNESDNNTYKIRLIERMSEYNNQFGPSSQSGRIFENNDAFRKYTEGNTNDFKDLNQSEMLDILKFMNDNKPAAREADFSHFLNSIDRDGYSLVHYLCYLKYYECLKYVLTCGASVKIESANAKTALDIAHELKDEQMLEILLHHGALDPKKMDELLKRANESLATNLDLASLYKDRVFLDMFLREVSLCDSMNNSLSVACAESMNHSDESYISLYDLLDERLGKFDEEDFMDDASSICSRKVDQSSGIIDHSLHDRRALKRPRRYHRDYNRKKNTLQKENIDTNVNPKTKIDPVIVADHQNQVQLIQKNVRGWLLRRQYLDILTATRVLQGYIRYKRKNGDKEAEIC